MIFIFTQSFYLIFSCIPLFFYLLSRCVIYYLRRTTDCVSVMDFVIFFIKKSLIILIFLGYYNYKTLFLYSKHVIVNKIGSVCSMELERSFLEFLDIFLCFSRSITWNFLAFHHKIMPKSIRN